MKKTFKIIYSVFLTSTFLFSCVNNKKEDTYELLTNGTWYLQDILAEGVTTMDPCEQDDKLTFFEREYNYDEDTTLCYENVEVTKQVWSFMDDGKAIKTKKNFIQNGTKDKTTRTWNILELTDSTLVLEEKIEGSFSNQMLFER